MINKIKKLNIFNKGSAQYRRRKSSGSGFVILYAVTLSAILLSIALGVAQIALKEIKFSASAKDTNEAFFAADTGAEQALFNDKTPGFYPDNTLTTLPIISGLGGLLQGCAKVTVDKTISTKTAIISKGYNIGSPLCNSTSSNLVERELDVNY
jgi:hypothetical protein